MHMSSFKALASCLGLSLLASKGQASKQARQLRPTNCQASDFEFVLPAGVLANLQELPPFITPEIFILFATLKDGWTPGFAKTETPIVIRIAHLIDTMYWNCAAMYSSTWLDALTKEEPFLRSPVEEGDIVFHTSSTRLLCMVHASAAVVNEWQPEAFPSLSGVLRDVFQFESLNFDFNPEVDNAFDKDTGEPDISMLDEIAASNCYKPSIMGAIVARQLTEYGRRDGYNMYGDLARDGTPCTFNCRRYTDSTATAASSKQSHRALKATKSSKRSKCQGARSEEKETIRWKPMLEDDGRGYFTRQEHVTPHIGSTAKRAILSDEDFESRGLESPNCYNYYSEAFRVAERLRETAGDDLKKATIEFFDDKIKVIFSVVSSVVSYGLSFEQILNFVLGLTSSEYDSILVSWKEKVKHNLIRPTTWIQEQMADVDFETYGGPFRGVQTIKGKEFESWVRVMPHSEYISGSACICQSIQDFTENWMELTDGDLKGASALNTFERGGSIAVPIATNQTGREAPFLQGSSKTEPDVTPSQDLTLVAGNMREFRDMCGDSRLDGGMHFAASVPDAYELCEGIGTQSALYSIDLLGEGGWEDTIVRAALVRDTVFSL